VLKAGVGGGVVEDLASGTVVEDLLQGQGSPGDVLGEGLSGFVIPTVEAHRVVHGEPRVLPAQEGLGERLGDEVKLEEQGDAAPV
jgi:hypothetical protein